jgi:hypothetical protein
MAAELETQETLKGDGMATSYTLKKLTDVEDSGANPM